MKTCYWLDSKPTTIICQMSHSSRQFFSSMQWAYRPILLSQRLDLGLDSIKKLDSFTKPRGISKAGEMLRAKHSVIFTFRRGLQLCSLLTFETMETTAYHCKCWDIHVFNTKSYYTILKLQSWTKLRQLPPSKTKLYPFLFLMVKPK